MPRKGTTSTGPATSGPVGAEPAATGDRLETGGVETGGVEEERRRGGRMRPTGSAASAPKANATADSRRPARPAAARAAGALRLWPAPRRRADPRPHPPRLPPPRSGGGPGDGGLGGHRRPRACRGHHAAPALGRNPHAGLRRAGGAGTAAPRPGPDRAHQRASGDGDGAPNSASCRWPRPPRPPQRRRAAPTPRRRPGSSSALADLPEGDLRAALAALGRAAFGR